jgi:glyoxylase-like metal-dependent hydrolase (beta-lactamase superfamily II)
VTVAVEQLADRLWTASTGTYRTVFVEASTSVIVCNTFGSAAAAQALRDAIAAAVPGKPIGTLVATIDHLDHSGFGAELAPDADVVAHRLTAEVITGRRADRQLAATRIVDGPGERVEIDGVALELLYPGPTVGTGNLAVVFPDRQLVFVVGPQANARYGLFADFHCERYPSSMRQLVDSNVATVVPGRYSVLTREQAGRAVGYFEALAVSAQQAFANGIPIWELEAMRAFCSDALRGEWGDLDGFEEHVGLGALRLVHHYLMGGWGLEDTQQPELLLER